MAEKEDTNLYHPEDADDGVSGVSPSSPKSPVVTWTASEYVEHQRGAGWYIILLLATAALAAGTFFLFHDKFATAIVVILGLILGFSVGHKPRQITYEVNATGLKVAQRPYAYSLFKSFTIFREGALSTITFYPLKRLALPISIFFDAKEEEKIVNLIGDHLPLEERAPDRFDRISRRLKI